MEEWSSEEEIGLEKYALQDIKLPGKRKRVVTVVRDDLLPGGTKVRGLQPWMERLVAEVDEYVYAGPVYGYAQIALAESCRNTGKQGTLFVAKRKELHPYTKRAQSLGTQVHEVPYGYLNVVKKRARDYVKQQLDLGRRTMLIPWGGRDEGIMDMLCEAFSCLEDDVGNARVWVCVGSGTLVAAMAKAWPEATFVCVQVGAKVDWEALPFSKDRVKAIYVAPEKYGARAKKPPPYPASDHYEAKMWQFLERDAKNGDWVWNVA